MIVVLGKTIFPEHTHRPQLSDGEQFIKPTYLNTEKRQTTKKAQNKMVQDY